MYRPILKGKKAEFESWKNISKPARTVVLPIFEIVAGKGLTPDLQKFRDGLLPSLDSGDTVAVDAIALGDGAIEPQTGLGVYTWLSKELSPAGITLEAVLHLNDSATQIKDAIAAVGNGNIVLRVGGTEGDPHPLSSDMTLSKWCKQANLISANVHLLVDFASIYGLSQSGMQSMAEAYLAWASSNGPWAATTLAAGAFPAQISNLPKSTPNLIPRSDAALWNSVRSTSVVPNLLFGDYGTRHPELMDGQVWNGPLPNLRYAVDAHWVVWREAKDQQQPHSTFYEVCRNIVSHPQFCGSQYSWGDGVIEQKSRNTPGPGSGTEWIIYGLNHHIEFVADRLTTRGAA